ncbi:MAG: AMP-binding protein [Dokdonella sp.]
MAVVFESVQVELDGGVAAAALPLLGHADPQRRFAWRDGQSISVAAFLAHVDAVANRLPTSRHAVNLCEDRYAFLVAFCACALRGQTSLLPPSRAPQQVVEVLATHADCYALSEATPCQSPPGLLVLPELNQPAQALSDAPPLASIAAEHVMAIGFTSGSTGQPKANFKTWDNFTIGGRLNAGLLVREIGLKSDEIAHVVATVPAQHMYGMELSVLLPLIGPFSVHAGRPFFPSDIAGALAELPAPRVLVTTPVHLRTLLRDATELPPIAAIVSATAPLDQATAIAAEQRFGAPVIEMFGSTETCVIAHRRTAQVEEWQLYDGVELHPQPDGTQVTAAHLNSPVLLQDVVELLPGRRFRLCGRNADLLEIAGKRASLADLTRRVLSLRGVHDAIVLQTECADGSGVQRIAALVVAPGRCEIELLNELRTMIDPVFLPRPLRRVTALPRNETGKLPRAALLSALHQI